MLKLFSFFLLFFFIHSNAQELKNCSICSQKIIQFEQIKNLSIDEIRYLINDLFARKGYQFSNPEIDFYYSYKDWYKPVKDNNQIVYNEIEKANIKLFQDRTTDLKKDREKLVATLIEFKNLSLAKNKEQLKTKYNFNISENDFDYLGKVLENIDLNKLNWFKSKAFYEKKIDNLNETISNSIYVEGKNIRFKYDYDSGSEFIREVLYPSDYYREFTLFWEFEYNNHLLKFIQFGGAG